MRPEEYMNQVTREVMYTKLLNKATADFQKIVAGIPALIEAAIKADLMRQETSQMIVAQKVAKKKMQDDCSHRHERDGYGRKQMHFAILHPEEDLYCQLCLAIVTRSDPRYRGFYFDAMLEDKEAMVECASREPMDEEESAWRAARGF